MQFYLGTTIAASMYIIGAVEIFLIYIMPQAKIFEDMVRCGGEKNQIPPFLQYHNFRLFGSILLILVGLIVLAGVKIVNKFALPAVLIVIACIACTFVGIFLKFDGTESLQYVLQKNIYLTSFLSLRFCIVGNRPVDLTGFQRIHGFVPNCTAEGLRVVFCVDPSSKEANIDSNASTTTTTTTTIRPTRSRGRVYSYAQPMVISNCDRYFERVLQKDPSAIRLKVAKLAEK